MKTFIALYDVDEYTRNEVEAFNDSTWEDFQQFLNTSRLRTRGILDIENFVHDSNNQEIDLENCWLAYIHIKDHRL